MGGHDSQKLLPRRGSYSSPGRSKPPADRTNTLTDRSPSRLQTSQAGSATHRMGHFWKAQVGHFSKAPKVKYTPALASALANTTSYTSVSDIFRVLLRQ